MDNTMTNDLVLLRLPDYTVLRHGGAETIRRWDVYVNGVLVEHFEDNQQRWGWNSGASLDRLMNQWLDGWKSALGCSVTKATQKDD